MRKKTHDMCEFCEGIVEERIIQARFHFKGQTIYVDRVPAWVSHNHKFKGEGRVFWYVYCPPSQEATPFSH